VQERRGPDEKEGRLETICTEERGKLRVFLGTARFNTSYGNEEEGGKVCRKKVGRKTPRARILWDRSQVILRLGRDLRCCDTRAIHPALVRPRSWPNLLDNLSGGRRPPWSKPQLRGCEEGSLTQMGRGGRRDKGTSVVKPALRFSHHQTHARRRGMNGACRRSLAEGRRNLPEMTCCKRGEWGRRRCTRVFCRLF